MENVKFYKSTEVAKIIGICVMTLRRWEKAGIIPTAKRLPFSHHRVYTKEDIETILRTIK